MRTTDLDGIPHAVVYEPAEGGGRQRLVGPFSDRDAANRYICGMNIAGEYDRAWASALLPPAADACKVAPAAEGQCMSGCGRPASTRITAPGGLYTEACETHLPDVAGHGVATPVDGA